MEKASLNLSSQLSFSRRTIIAPCLREYLSSRPQNFHVVVKDRFKLSINLIAKLYKEGLNKTMPTLQLRGITKRFGSLVANNNIDLDLKPGEVHGLIGENGAGKSTLMNIAYGLLEPDEGQILVDEEVVRFKSPIDALTSGIGMLHQHFKLAQSFTGLENIALYLQTNSNINFIQEAEKKAHEIKTNYGFDIDLNKKVSVMGAHEQQLVELIKLFCANYKVLILDEPTSVLVGEQIDRLLKQVIEWAKMGYAIVFISHKLDEIITVSDRITVLRKGSVVERMSKEEASKDRLIRAVVGGELPVVKKVESIGLFEKDSIMLRVNNLSAVNNVKTTVINDVSFQVSKGEIYGIAGIMGNGQDHLVDLITGTNIYNNRITGGKIYLKNYDVTYLSASDIVAKGQDMAYIPPKAIEMGLASGLSFAENALLRNMRSFGKYFINWHKVVKYSERMISEYSIAANSPKTRVGTLSGGNKIKTVIAREFERKTDLMVVFDPSAGLDIKSIKKLEQNLLEARKHAAIVYVGDDLDMLLSVSDRIGVMFKGTLIEAGKPFSKERIGQLMTGGA